MRRNHFFWKIRRNKEHMAQIRNQVWWWFS